MGRKVLCLMLMILALAPCARAETPQALPQCSTREEVEAWVDFGLEEADELPAQLGQVAALFEEEAQVKDERFLQAAHH